MAFLDFRLNNVSNESYRTRGIHYVDITQQSTPDLSNEEPYTMRKYNICITKSNVQYTSFTYTITFRMKVATSMKILLLARIHTISIQTSEDFEKKSSVVYN